ncbi:MAG: dephospho-CoA kinase [Paludibacteraceae bacterium]|nr:dephospho-CoA kinase [Paludibacteraceae bacterium]
MVIGVTGGIGSGKTYFCKLLEMASLPVFYSDTEAKRIMDEDFSVKTAITELLGEEAYTVVAYTADSVPVEKLDRKYVAKKIFSDPDMREKINAIVHPAVFKAFNVWQEKQESNVTVIESAILFECGLDKYVDKTIVVAAPLDLRIKRLKERDNMSDEEIKRRMASQADESSKLRRADVIIKNGPDDDVNRQIFTLLKSIQEELFTPAPTVSPCSDN